MNIKRFGIAYLLFCVLNVVLLGFGLAVIGMYGIDLQRADAEDRYADGKWVYAVVTGGLSSLTAILLCVPYVLRFMVVPVWNFILFALYIALFGVFAKMYLHEDPEGVDDIERMKRAVWVDLINAVGWLVYAVAAAVYWWMHRDRHSRFTGRARV